MFDHLKLSPLNRAHLFSLFFVLVMTTSTCHTQAPPTFAQALQQHHVEITKAALIQALSNSDKEVRGLAAAELAELKITAALPDIIRAAQNENDAMTQVNIAAAATWLGSDEGLQLLKRICSNPTTSAYVRINAARNAFDKQDHACFPALAELMKPSAALDERISALSVASQIRPRSEEETKVVLSSALSALQDTEIRVRLQACEALRWMKDPRALLPLQKGIDIEREEVVRQQMQSTLSYLEKQAKP